MNQTLESMIIPLSERLNAAAAPALKAMLEAKRTTPVTLDASKTIILSAQVVQVLIAARNTWSKDAVAFAIRPCSAEMNQTLDLLGIPPQMIGMQEIYDGA